MRSRRSYLPGVELYCSTAMMSGERLTLLEYLEIPGALLLHQIKAGQPTDLRVGEVETRQHYHNHPDEFATPSDDDGQAEVNPQVDAQPQAKPYLEVRQQILANLRRDHARRLGHRISAAAADIQFDDQRSQIRSQQAGSSVLPMSFEKLAERLQNQRANPAPL